MSNDMVLLRVMAGAWEGWKWMHFEEFLQRLDLAAWRNDEVLVGMVLPPPARGNTTLIAELRQVN